VEHTLRDGSSTPPTANPQPLLPRKHGDGRYAVGPAAAMDVYRIQSSKVRNATLES
jgi:hypothetical protein